MSVVSFNDLKLLRLTVEEIGPFRDGPGTLAFRGIPAPGETAGPPSTLFMLLAKNAHGKTTLLETVFALFALLAEVSPAPSILSAGGRAQLDLRMTWIVDGVTQTVLLSIWAGSDRPLRDWTPDEIEADAQASRWAQVGFTFRPGYIPERHLNDLGKLLLDTIAGRLGLPPTALRGQSSDLPCVLFFPAHRTLVSPGGQSYIAAPENWGYHPAIRFEADGADWETSLDNLLIWLDWLDDGRLDELLKYINATAFRDSSKELRRSRRDTLTSVVSTVSGTHSVGQLSHGERALLQLYVRTLCHMTANTVVLIDEIELHLHTVWMNRMFQALKQMLRETPSLSVVFTTHNRELIKLFDHQVPEQGIIKGGFLIEDGLSADA